MNAIYARLERGEYVEGFGASWVLGQDEDGDLRVPSVVQRLKRGEPWWSKRFNPRNPWHWVFFVWTRAKGGATWIESGA